MLDIYNEFGEKTGESCERGRKLKNGEYNLAVHVYIINKKGEFLIQKRSMKKKVYPGLWDITGGVAVKGENSPEAAIREVHEELGIHLSLEDLVYITRLKRKGLLVDVWAAYNDTPIEDIVMQRDEVDDVKYVSGNDLVDIVFGTEYRDDEYKDIIIKFIKK